SFTHHYMEQRPPLRFARTKSVARPARSRFWSGPWDAFRHLEFVANEVDTRIETKHRLRQPTIMLAGHGATENDGGTIDHHTNRPIGIEPRRARQDLLHFGRRHTRRGRSGREFRTSRINNRRPRCSGTVAGRSKGGVPV